jgi:hypothetical protein
MALSIKPFSVCLSTGDSGGIWTLYLRIISLVFHHFATGAKPIVKVMRYYKFSHNIFKSVLCHFLFHFVVQIEVYSSACFVQLAERQTEK